MVYLLYFHFQKYENIYSSLPLSGRQKDSSRDIVAGSLYLFPQKVPKNSPTDAYAYNGSGIESESLAANGGAGVRRLFYEYLRRTESESQ